MKSILSRHIIVTATILLTLGSTGLNAQDSQSLNENSPISLVSDEVYDETMNSLFSRKVLNDNLARFVLVLRYEPSFSEESQLIIANYSDHTQILEYRPTRGSVYSQLNGILHKAGSVTSAEAITKIDIKKMAVKLTPTQIYSLHESFLRKICLSARYERKVTAANNNKVTLTADGTKYFLWYKNADGVNYSFASSSARPASITTEHPVALWMKYVEQVISRAKKDRK